MVEADRSLAQRLEVVSYLLGRPRVSSATEQAIKEARQQGKDIKRIACELKISVSTCSVLFIETQNIRKLHMKAYDSFAVTGPIT